MCGISGHLGITDPFAKIALTVSLGEGIDKRGGDAVGFLSIKNSKLQVCKKLGTYKGASNRFLMTAVNADMCMMHARWATCGKKTVEEAHPFVIKRNGRTKITGCHNGIVYNANESAKRNNRSVEVDSQEIFELIADGDIEGIKKLQGYGVVTYVRSETPDTIELIRLTDNSDIYVCELTNGGIVYGSTKTIVHDALELSNLEVKNSFKLDDIGRIYLLRTDGVYASNVSGYKFAESYSSYSFMGGWGGLDSFEGHYASGKYDGAYRSRKNRKHREHRSRYSYGESSSKSEFKGTYTTFDKDKNIKEFSSFHEYLAYKYDSEDPQDWMLSDDEKLGLSEPVDGQIELEDIISRYGSTDDKDPDSEDSDVTVDEDDLFEVMTCDACGEDVDDDEMEQNEWAIAELYGTEVAKENVYCEACLWDFHRNTSISSMYG